MSVGTHHANGKEAAFACCHASEAALVDGDVQAAANLYSLSSHGKETAFACCHASEAVDGDMQATP